MDIQPLKTTTTTTRANGQTAQQPATAHCGPSSHCLSCTCARSGEQSSPTVSAPFFYFSFLFFSFERTLKDATCQSVMAPSAEAATKTPVAPTTLGRTNLFGPFVASFVRCSFERGRSREKERRGYEAVLLSLFSVSIGRHSSLLSSSNFDGTRNALVAVVVIFYVHIQTHYSRLEARGS